MCSQNRNYRCLHLSILLYLAIRTAMFNTRSRQSFCTAQQRIPIFVYNTYNTMTTGTHFDDLEQANQLEMRPDFWNWVEKRSIWQPWPVASKGADMSELQAHHCMTPEQWTWLWCSVIVVSANKLSLHEINQLIGIELPDVKFSSFFGS